MAMDRIGGTMERLDGTDEEPRALRDDAVSFLEHCILVASGSPLASDGEAINQPSSWSRTRSGPICGMEPTSGTTWRRRRSRSRRRRADPTRSGPARGLASEAHAARSDLARSALNPAVTQDDGCSYFSLCSLLVGAGTTGRLESDRPPGPSRSMDGVHGRGSGRARRARSSP
jgi:hypothetical protein